MKKLTTSDFIIKSKQKHKDKYDYSESEYIDSRTNVKIICPEHGLFLQNPQSHYNGSECPICSQSTKIKSRLGDINQIKQSFIDKSNLIHNNKYDYNNVNYINSQTKVCIICPIHGEFLQTPNDHSQGHGCAKCVGLDKKEYMSTNININLKDLIINDFYQSKSGKIIGSVYIFINKKNDKKYIGKTTMKINERFNTHKYNCNNSKCNNYFYRAIRKYGWEEFDKYIIFQTDELEDTNENKKLIDSIICDKEAKFITDFQSNNPQFGYNLTKGGDGIVGFKHSEKSKKEMSKSRKGIGNSMYGKTLEKNPRSIPILQLDLEGLIIKRWSCAVEINNRLGYSITRIRDCYNNKCEIYKGYK